MRKSFQKLDIGKNIQRLRQKQRLTQAQVVRMMNLEGCLISENAYIKIENGYRNIRISELMLLKTILQCSYNDFFDGLSIK